MYLVVTSVFSVLCLFWMSCGLWVIFCVISVWMIQSPSDVLQDAFLLITYAQNSVLSWAVIYLWEFTPVDAVHASVSIEQMTVVSVVLTRFVHACVFTSGTFTSCNVLFCLFRSRIRPAEAVHSNSSRWCGAFTRCRDMLQAMRHHRITDSFPSMQSRSAMQLEWILQFW